MRQDDLPDTSAPASAPAPAPAQSVMEAAVGAVGEAHATEGQIALSHSQVETFAQCPRRWWLLKRAGARRAPSESLILGLAVHAAIEADLRMRLARDEAPTVDTSARPPDAPPVPTISPTPGSTIWGDVQLAGPRGHSPSPASASSVVNPSGPGDDDPLTTAFAALFAEEDPAGLIAVERRSLLLAQGSAALRAYERLAPHLRPVEIERDFSFTHPGDPSIIFTGRMDAVTQPDHGTQERTIVDWKVPRRSWAAGEEGRRIQAAAYLWAEACMGWERSARFTFVTFPPAAMLTPEAGDEAASRVVDARPTYRTTAQLDAYARLVRQTATRIREWEPWGEDGFPARTSGLCPWCEVRGACPVGQRYVRQRGLIPRVPELPPEEGGPGALTSE